MLVTIKIGYSKIDLIVQLKCTSIYPISSNAYISTNRQNACIKQLIKELNKGLLPNGAKIGH